MMNKNRRVDRMELVKYENNELVVSNSVIDILKDFKKKKVEIELQEKQLREELLEAMEKYGIQNWKSNDETITAIYKKGYQRNSIDSTRLKKELPDVAEEYSKTIDVKPSVELTIEV